MWFVLRHSGRRDSEWRIAYQGHDEGKARAQYWRIDHSLRQGQLQLVCDGVVIDRSGAAAYRKRV